MCQHRKAETEQLHFTCICYYIAAKTQLKHVKKNISEYIVSGVIVGGVLAALTLVGLVVCAVFYLYIRRFR